MKNESAYPEKQYISTTDPDRRKTFGQIFTPPRIAALMTRWITSKVRSGRLLDPALGLGIFFRMLTASQTGGTADPASCMEAGGPDRSDPQPGPSAMETTWMDQRAGSPYRLEGYEVDPHVAAAAGENFARWGIPLECHREDFLMAEAEPVYDGIICNPPYLHFQEYKHSLTLIQKFNQQYGMELNGFSNIYALFLIKALHLLKPGGRAAFILPSEFLNADYGTSIKALLTGMGSLAKILIFAPSLQIFPGCMTTSAIFLFEEGWTGDVEMFPVHHLAELDEIESFLYSASGTVENRKCYSHDQLDPGVKWRQYYSDLKINLHLQKRSHLIPLHTFAQVRRGIATGANEFFTLSEEERKERKIAMQYLTPCVTKASHVQSRIFDEAEMAKLIEGGRRVFLLNLGGERPSAAVQEYIRWGEANGFAARYLTRNRHPWYSTEQIPPADLWVKTFGRNRVVFIENLTQALHLTCFHGIYLNPLGRQYREAIFLYLITDLAREIFEGQKREYGSGLGKFEPNDVRNADLLDLRRLTEQDRRTLVHLYQHYRKNVHTRAGGLDGICAEAEQIFYKYW